MGIFSVAVNRFHRSSLNLDFLDIFIEPSIFWNFLNPIKVF